MSLLLNSLVVSDSTSKYHNLLVNILISSDGIIKKICVEDGQPVEYGQTIIIVE